MSMSLSNNRDTQISMNTSYLFTIFRNHTGWPRVAGNNQEAFTLLEVMVAIAILALGVSMLFGSQSQSIALITESQFNTQASFLAGLKIAEYECGKEEPLNNDGDFGENHPGYSWKVEVDQPSLAEIAPLDDAEENIQKLNLTISWGDGRYVHGVTYYLHTGVRRGSDQNQAGGGDG